MRIRVRRWALLTAVLYGLTLAGLSAPLLTTALYGPSYFGEGIRSTAQIYTIWQYWLGIGVLMLLEGLLLLTPISVARHKPVSRGSWHVLAITAGLMMGLLAAGLTFTIWETFKLKGDAGEVPVSRLTALGLGGAMWAWWAIVFSRYAYAKHTAAAYRRVIDRLMGGSIAELLIAVPCHVHVRHRHECCAGFGTFMGLATGLSVLVFAFGPGVFFLFVARVKRLRREDDETDSPSELTWLGRRTLYARRALLWAVGAVLFLTALLVAGATGQEKYRVLFNSSRVSFVLIAGMACYYAACSAGRREPGWRVAAAGSVLLAEVVVLAALWGW